MNVMMNIAYIAFDGFRDKRSSWLIGMGSRSEVNPQMM